MSYTKIELNGAQVGLKFGYEAVKNFLVDCDSNKDDYFDKDNGLTVFGIASMMYWAYKNNQELKEEEATFKMEDFEDWVVERSSSEEGLKELAAIGKLYEESRYVKLFIRQANKAVEDLKKKTSENTLKKSKQSSLAKA